MNTTKRSYYFLDSANVCIASISASSLTEACKIADAQLLDYESCTTIQPPAPARTPGEILDDTIDLASHALKQAQPVIRTKLSRLFGSLSHKLAPKTTTTNGTTLVQS